MPGKFCVVLTCAKDNPDRATVAFVVANAAVASDQETVVFLTVEGVRLAARGYAPVARDWKVVLRNCPFHTVAREFPPLVCGMNLALLEGMVEGARWPCAATLDPAPGRCCVMLTSKTND